MSLSQCRLVSVLFEHSLDNSTMVDNRPWSGAAGRLANEQHRFSAIALKRLCECTASLCSNSSRLLACSERHSVLLTAKKFGLSRLCSISLLVDKLVDDSLLVLDESASKSSTNMDTVNFFILSNLAASSWLSTSSSHDSNDSSESKSIFFFIFFKSDNKLVVSDDDDDDDDEELDSTGCRLRR
ncbi:hypothetical protein BpHYR1_021836 [Brachionus plicatilis]|uniref:Uncharacterized protein n=1 Tax=Brachionus plicatilis TaxID=10195 RepID=A0A3M7T480_BRAPC|nr:hypothetical protein BpHYR1_021836 [Brachionus plicatilis]